MIATCAECCRQFSGQDDAGHMPLNCPRCEGGFNVMFPSSLAKKILNCQHCGSDKCYGMVDGVMVCCVTGRTV